MRSYLSKFIILLLLVSFLAPLEAIANGNDCPPGAICIDNPLGAENFWDLIDKLIDFVFYLAVAIGPIMITVAGIYFITAMGEPGKIQTAKKIILYTLIGLLIVFSAKGLIKLLGDILGADIVPKE